MNSLKEMDITNFDYSLEEVKEILRSHEGKCKSSFYNFNNKYKVHQDLKHNEAFLVPNNSQSLSIGVIGSVLIKDNLKMNGDSLTIRDIASFKEQLELLQKSIEQNENNKLVYHWTTAKNAISILNDGYIHPSRYESLHQFGILWRGHMHNGWMKLYMDKQKEKLKISSDENEIIKCKKRIEVLNVLAYEFEHKTFMSSEISRYFLNDQKNQILFAIDSEKLGLNKMNVYQEIEDDNELINYYVRENEIEINKTIQEFNAKKVNEFQFSYKSINSHAIKYVIVQDICNIYYIFKKVNDKYQLYNWS